jgi:hypothetical protein
MATREEKNNFCLMIEEMAGKMNLSLIDAITHYCEESGLEVEVAASLINENLKSKIEVEAQTLRFIQRSSRLPI